ncbi:DNA-binding transcriptional response regulator [Arenibaculum pallidiluteum]|uniref:hypothetical protein n=1 Tax=Arenibaculum pallidiluteum TaxID=2812559 RepID=UPI001A976B12|nr:hypothetical protein [Arenibaculum pallidiluteum]
MARILVAGGDEALRRALCARLRRAGHVAEGVADGAEVLAVLRDPAARALGWDLLIADLDLPSGRPGAPDAAALASLALRQTLELRVLFISGFVAVPFAPAEGFAARIPSKPIHLRELPRQIDRILAA